MATPTVENYVKQIYLAAPDHVGGLLPLGELAEAVGVVPGTATTMVKSLADAGLAHYQARRGVQLTDAGRRLALHVLRRHRLIESFLVGALGFDWSEVHDEAEELEHVVSDKLLERIDAFLNRPVVDPHGDPIPTPAGTIAQTPPSNLANCPLGESMHVARVVDQSGDFLRFLDRNGLIVGTDLKVINRESAADAVQIRVGRNKRITLGAASAAKVLVAPNTTSTPIAQPRHARRPHKRPKA